MLSAGGGFPDFYTVGIYLKNSTNPATDRVLVKDYGALFLRGDLYNPKHKIDLGINLLYTRQYFEYNTQMKYARADTVDYQEIGIGIRINKYLIRKTHFHTYIGAGLGGRIPLKDQLPTPVYGELVLGLRFIPAQRFGIYIEVGPSKVLAQAGVSIKL